jgi:SAM-dependent methyltransferase
VTRHGSSIDRQDCVVDRTSNHVDYDRDGEQYDRTRGQTVGTTAYEAPVRHALEGGPPGPMLDIGSGTGAWSAVLAAWAERTLVAIEPAAGMRAVAAAIAGTAEVETGGRSARPRVHIVGGQGGSLPLRGGVAGAAWLSTVIHHVGDLDMCARELRRVLAPGAPVLIRSAFPGRYDGIGLVRFFPATRRVLDSFPSVEAVRTAFGDAGFGFVSIERVYEPPVDYRTWRERLPHQRSVDTILVGVTDDEFADGLRAIDAAIAAGREPEPVGLDLLVLR